MQLGDDFSADIGVNKFFGNFKMFSEDIQFSITPDKADERDGSIRNVIKIGKLEFWRRKNRDEVCLLNRLERGSSLEAAIPMVFIMEDFKVLRLGSEISIIAEPLGAKEPAVVSVIEALHRSIAPRLSDGDKDDFDSHGKTEAKDDTERTRMPVAAPKAEFVVDLKEVGDPHSFPATDQAQSDGLVVFPSLGVDKNAMAVKIDDVKRIESSIVFDVTRAEEVGLMDVVELQSFPKIRVFHSFGLVRGFF
jgi:hypothetical protein